MNFREKYKKRRRQVIVPISGIGDLAFLLIMFFMIASSFVRQSHVDLERPEAEDLERLKESAVYVSIDREGRIYLQGVQVPNAEAVEWGVSALIEDAGTEEERTVLLTSDRDLPESVFRPVIVAITEAGARIAAMGENLGESGEIPTPAETSD
ncbi:MAG: ExbD/TolR family protein [Opitutales bacterium]